MNARKTTADFPLVLHQCDVTGGLEKLRFHGATAKSGLTVECTYCLTVYEYRKPMPSVVPMPSGPRSHF